MPLLLLPHHSPPSNFLCPPLVSSLFPVLPTHPSFHLHSLCLQTACPQLPQAPACTPSPGPRCPHTLLRRGPLLPCPSPCCASAVCRPTAYLHSLHPCASSNVARPPCLFSKPPKPAPPCGQRLRFSPCPAPPTTPFFPSQVTGPLAAQPCSLSASPCTQSPNPKCVEKMKPSPASAAAAAAQHLRAPRWLGLPPNERGTAPSAPRRGTRHQFCRTSL